MDNPYEINFLTVVVLLLIAAGVFFALRAIFVKKKGRCGGSCDDCPYHSGRLRGEREHCEK